MVRNVVLLVIFLLLIGGTDFAGADRVIYDFYDAPSSGSLGLMTDTGIHNASPFVSAMPAGGFGPPTVSFQIQNGLSSAVQAHPALQFKDRWLF
jgi:hypothetical protein